MSNKSTPIVLTSTNWDTAGNRYMQPKINDRGGKSINIISSQTNRSLHISTPLLMTWGITDFVDDKTGESDGKFSMSLNFPNDDYSTTATTDFLNKLKAFENQILDDAVKYSEVWFGEEMSREVAKHTFFPFLKYSKDKLTKKFDYNKPPAIRAKVPNYNQKWSIEIYDTKQNLLFPSENSNLTPMDFVPKKSNVACVLQCGGLWFGGKGWGITWKVNQCVVKPSEVISVFGKCHIQLSLDDIECMDQPATTTEIEDNTEVVNTVVADSDDDEEEESGITETPIVKTVPVPVVKPVVKPVPVPTPIVQQVPVPKKKVIKKKAVSSA
jgi:hypothetical protein